MSNDMEVMRSEIQRTDSEGDISAQINLSHNTNTSASTSANTGKLSDNERSKVTRINVSKLCRNDFYFGVTLGEGAYARVVHAKMKPTIQGLDTSQQVLLYIIKIISVRLIIRNKQITIGICDQNHGKSTYY